MLWFLASEVAHLSGEGIMGSGPPGAEDYDGLSSHKRIPEGREGDWSLGQI